MNKLDKAIAVVAPGWAERRMVSRHNIRVMNTMLPNYNGGSDTRRRRQVSISNQREDTAVTTDYSHMIAAAMNLYRNDPMTRSIVDVVATYMGESRPMAMTSDADFNVEADQFFNDFWWGQADARRRPGVDYGQIQHVWTKFSWLGGDMLFALTDEGLYPYEGLQIRTPWDLRTDANIVNGVRIQSAPPHRISHYYVTDGDKPMWYTRADKDFRRIRQNEAIFAPSKYWRAAMLRGIPELHGVIDALQDWEETNDNVQGLIKLQSSIWTVERKGAIANLPQRFVDKDTATGEQAEYSKADYGMRLKINGSPKDDFQITSMDNPGAQHVPYMEYMGRIISAGTGLPYEVVMHLYTNGSYTANRAARCDFKTFILDRWAWRNKVLNQRVRNWAIAKAIKAREIRPAPLDSTGRSEWWRCSWTLPYFPQIDEGKEAAANVKRWGMADKSLADVAQEQGRTRTMLLDAHDADVIEMKKRAEAIGVPLEVYAGELFSKPAMPAQGGDNA